MAVGQLHFVLEIDGERQLSRKLHGYLGNVTDLSGAFEKMAEDWRQSRIDVFVAEGAYDGQGAWAPLAESTKKAKEAAGYGAALILQRTAELYRAATQPETTIEPLELRMVIESDYGVYHQSPRPRQPKPDGTGPILPRREFASLGAKQKSRWMRFMREHLFRED